MIGGGGRGTTLPPWISRNFSLSRAMMPLAELFDVLPLFERLQRDDHESGIGLRVVVDEVQADDEV